jgi:HAE1 family hydrophobic/amphiphilic exporter-1
MLMRRFAIAIVLLLVVSAAVVLLGARLPGGFLPTEDQGYAYVNLQLPQGASLQRTSEAAKSVEDALNQGAWCRERDVGRRDLAC